jgi:hypothetical protein
MNQQMSNSQKYITLFAIIGFLVLGLPLGAICSSYCAYTHIDLDSTAGGSCPVTSHFFVQVPGSWAAISLLPPSDLSPARESRIVSPGFYWPLFRPPRFSL